MWHITSETGTCIYTVIYMKFDVERLIREEVKDLPVYSPGKSPEEVAREFGLEDCVKMASNENPLGPSPMAVEAAKAALSTMSIYPDGSSSELKEAISRKLGIETEFILIGHGADEIFDLLAYAFLDTGRDMVVGDPSFSSYELAARTMGARVCRIPLKEYRQDIPAMLRAVEESTSMVMLCTPLNPTGTTVNTAELEEMVEGLRENVILVLDEAYMEYVTDPKHPDAMAYFGSYPQLVITRTFSKIYGLAGLRVGYAICRPEIRQALEKVKLPFNVNRLGQVAALAALEDEEHVLRSKEMNKQGKQRLYNILDELGLEYVPTQANFILVKNGDYPDLFEKLLRQGIIVRDGEALGLPGHVRITIGDDVQNDRLEQALVRVVGEG
jgi:histidinol-phosphate aminotransferase